MVLKNIAFQAKNGDCPHGATDRLLDAAERLFCERGFDGTSVRDLTNEAGCNVAAVNYHFGNKENLYKQMFKRHLERVFSFHKQNIKKVMSAEDPTVEKLIESLVRPTLEQSAQEQGQMPMLKLTIRESLNPQFKKEVVALETITEFLIEIQKALLILFPQLDAGKAMLCVYSLEGLVIHPMLFSDFYYEITPELRIEELIQHIVKFAAAGIRQAAQE